jgi:hypothetical protein
VAEPTKILGKAGAQAPVQDDNDVLDAYLAALDTVSALSGGAIAPEQVRIGNDGSVFVNFGGGETRIGDFASLVGGGSSAQPTSAEDFTALGFSPEQAQTAAQAAALFGTGASAGVAEKILFGGGGGAGAGFAPPSLQFDVDPRSGEAIRFNPRTGAIERTGEQVGFAGIDPREAFQEQVRQSENAQGLDLATLAEDAARFRSGAAETAGFNRATLAENARQADTEAALREFSTRANLVPAFGQIALGAAREGREILSGGKDFLARAFGQANQDSPLGHVTQADMINNLMSQLAQIEQLVPESRATGRQSFEGAPEFRGLDPFSAPELSGFPGLSAAPGMTRGGGGAPAAAGGATGGGGAAGGGGGAVPAAAAASPGFQPGDLKQLLAGGGSLGQPEAAPALTAAAGRMGSFDESMLGASRGPGFARVQGVGNAALTPESARLFQGQFDVSPGSGFSVSPEQGGGGGGAVPGFIQRLFGIGTDRSAQRGLDAFGQPVPGFNEGTVPGFTRERIFAAGDPGNGRLGRDGELIANPTGAPIGVVRNEDVPRGTRVVPGFAHGTGGGGEGEDASGFAPEDAARFLQSLPADRDALMSALPIGAVGPAGRGGAVADDVLRALKTFDEARFAERLARTPAGAASAGADVAGGLASRLGQLKGVVPGFATGTGLFDQTVQRGGQTVRLGDISANEFGFSDPSGKIKFGDLDPSIAEGFRTQGIGVDAPSGSDSFAGGAPTGTSRFGQRTTQDELIALARGTAPPRVRQVRAGQLPAPPNLTGGLKGFRRPTLRQASALSGDERGALNTLLNVESSGLTDLNEILSRAAFTRNAGRRGRVTGFGL